MSNPSILTPESFLNFNADANLQQGDYHIDIPELKAGEQYRFHFDTTACIGCHACEVACNEQNNNASDVKWRRVGEMSVGTFPEMTQLFNSMSCNHCIDPECLKGCPTESYIKIDNGIVIHDDDTCIGCQYCVHVASNTFTVDEFHGRSRAIRQDGDSSDVIQEAIDTCPVDCIHWVKFEELDDLENSLDRDMFQTFGKPPRMNKH